MGSDYLISSEKVHMDSKPIRVAIIGGGLGGLACALALQNVGIHVTVYEQDRKFSDRREGFGLTLTNNKKGPLAKLGILEDCLQRDCPSYWHWIFNSVGDILGYYGREFHDKPECSSGERGNIRIPRQQLRSILLDRLKPDTVCWGMKLIDYLEEISGISCKFESCQRDGFNTEVRITTDILIGADGLRSVVRQLRDEKSKIPISSPLRYIGVSVIIGLSSFKHPLVNGGGFYVVDGTQRLFVMPFSSSPTHDSTTAEHESSGLTMWQLSFSNATEEEGKALRSSAPDYLLTEALRRTAGWMPPVQNLIEGTSPEDVWGTALYDREPMTLPARHTMGVSSRKRKQTAMTGTSDDFDKHPSDSFITVLGDASHPMCMFKGQGCNQALEDGPLLASWLARPGLNIFNLNTRLRCFEREMVARTRAKVLASRDAAESLHSPTVFDNSFGIEGVEGHLMAEVLEQLRLRHITPTANVTNLVADVRQVIQQVRAAPSIS